MTDPFFGPAYHDVDEWRDTPVRHRYVHGGFEGTDTRFSLYLPPPEGYQGRLLQFLEGERGGNEDVVPRFSGHAVAAPLGAALCESNQGHLGLDMSGLKGDNTIFEYRASAQTARHAQAVCAAMYGTGPHHTYVYGGSGGAMRTVSCLEGAHDVYDGGVAFMINRNGLMLWNWSLLAWAWSVLEPKLPAVIDAVDAGGGGDPFAVLDTDEQCHALAMLYRGGYPRGAEAQIEANPLWVLSMQIVAAADPAFFRDAPVTTTVHEKVRVTAVRTTAELPPGDLGIGGVPPTLPGRSKPDKPVGVAVDLEGGTGRFLGATITVLTGAAAGRKLICTGWAGDALVAAMDVQGFAGVEPGDEIEVDNTSFAAFCAFHRHLGDLPYESVDAVRVDGRPVYPPRPLPTGRMPVPTGRFAGKLILIQHTHDRECWPECAEAYARSVRAELGDGVEDRFRLWWIENASHLPPVTPAARQRLINYSGIYAQAVRDLAAWTEEGTAPAPSTDYTFGPDTRLTLPVTAAERGGIQPVVHLERDRIEVGVGEDAVLAATVEVPAGTGSVVIAEWESGDGRRAQGECVTFTYVTPGTYFAVFHVASQREGDPAAFTKVRNLARVRVVVS